MFCVSAANPPSLSVDVVAPGPPVLEQSEETTIPPLVFQFENAGNECVVMGMMKNGKPEVLKNEQWSETTPAFAGFIDGKGLAYGAESKEYQGPREVWRCIDFGRTVFPQQSIDLEEFGLFNLPHQFFVAFLIRKLKITAEVQRNGRCQVAILAVPLKTKCAGRFHLKEAARLAGFKDVCVTSAEGLAAFYWFSEKTEEMERNNYSKEFVIIDLFGHAVVYQKCVECGVDGKEQVGVKAVLLLDIVSGEAKAEAGFCRLIQKRLNIDRMTTLIPVLSETGQVSEHFYLGRQYENKIGVVKNDESDKLMYFAAKGAALQSENPGDIGHRVRNMIGSTIMMDCDERFILPFRILPETFARLTWSIKHDKVKYRFSQIGIGGETAQDTIGYLAIIGVKYGTDLKVSCEVNWEGVWKVVGVAAKNDTSEDEVAGGYTPVKWDWLDGEEAGFTNFGCSSNEECKALLLKVAPSPSQPQVASTEEPTPNVSPIDLVNSLDESVNSGIAITTGNANGIEEREEHIGRYSPKYNDQSGVHPAS